MGLLANLQVSGDLAGLARRFMEDRADTDNELYRYLQSFQPNSRISFRQWWDLLQALDDRYPEEAVAVELGRLVGPEYVGVLGHLLLSSRTLADALQGFQRYQRLLHDGDRAEASFERGLVCLSWTTDFGPSSRLSDEVLLVGLIAFVRRMVTNPLLAPAEVHFTFAQPVEADALVADLGCPVSFAQARTAVYLQPWQLNLPVSTHDSGLHSLLEQQAQALVSVLPQEDPFTVRLRQALLASIQQGQPEAEVVASYLCMSVRTLFRRLSAIGLRFADVLTSVRMQLAREYLLEGRLTQSEIALLLGYSEQSAFNRAFRKVTGLPPARWLREQKNSGSTEVYSHREGL